MTYQYLLLAVEEKVATVQEWLFRTYIGSEDNHRRIDALQAQLAAARKQ